MTLGERIMKLRVERQMSQSDLAEALDVSRQSISKWETDSSVPELDKLVMLCEIFGVSMDMLVRGIGEKEPGKPCGAPEAYTVRSENETVQPREVVHVVKFETRKIAGMILFVCAAVCIMACTTFGDIVAGFLLALPFIVCGVICFSFKKRAGLWCAWFIYFFCEVFLRFATGVSAGIVTAFLRGHIEMGVNVIVGFAELLLILGLILWTVWSFRNTDIRPARNKDMWLAGGWIVFILLRAALALMWQFVSMRAGYLVYIMVKDWIFFSAFVLLVIWTYHWWKERRVARNGDEASW